MRYNIDVDPRIKTPDDVAGKLWDFPVYVELHGDIDEESAAKFRSELKNAENAANKAGQDILPITIDTNGGCAYSCLSIMDAINNCPLDVATIVESKAMSAGVFIFSCGADGHRYIGPNATLMIHTVGLGSRGKIDEVRASADEGDRLNDKLFKMMDKNCGKHESYFQDLIKAKNNANWYLNSEEALKHGVASKIHLPSLSVKIALTFEFK